MAKTVTHTRMGTTRGSIDLSPEKTHAIPEDIMSNLDVGQAIFPIGGFKPFYIELGE